jgi:hypothetical protein
MLGPSPFRGKTKAAAKDLPATFAFHPTFPGEKPFPKPKSGHNRGLQFSDGNGPFWANFNATFTTQAFIHIHGLGLSVFDLQHADRTGIHTFTFSVALIFVDRHFVHVLSFTSSISLEQLILL